MERLKQSQLGKSLYRMSNSTLGAPLKSVAVWAQTIASLPRHLAGANRRHNADQLRVLRQFEAKHTGGK